MLVFFFFPRKYSMKKFSSIYLEHCKKYWEVCLNSEIYSSLMLSKLDFSWGVWVWDLAGSLWERLFTLPMLLCTQGYKWVLAICQGSLMKCWGVTLQWTDISSSACFNKFHVFHCQCNSLKILIQLCTHQPSTPLQSHSEWVYNILVHLA